MIFSLEAQQQFGVRPRLTEAALLSSISDKEGNMEDEPSLQVEIIKEKSQKELDDEIKKKKEKQARF